MNNRLKIKYTSSADQCQTFTVQLADNGDLAPSVLVPELSAAATDPPLVPVVGGCPGDAFVIAMSSVRVNVKLSPVSVSISGIAPDVSPGVAVF
ncbi:hypothetical protein GH808_02535 [Acetobacterium fimetarium]|uniref:Uncharacterized protein n=1 Tax=Acetobacterium fimetarium TaxID=52691 RepID=A0ABR6WRY4_9FIRM|nr:hypothetical protein [Acetobacterium fimetarium]MBC3803321.1 hypothetical protein [Acetobacterium fimetarium]